MSAVTLCLLAALSQPPPGADVEAGAAAPKPDAAAERAARNVYVGLFLSDVSGFEMKEGRFNADLELWVKWRGGEEVPQVSLLNGEIETREELERENDGEWRAVRWRVQGTFRGTFPLQHFPFDQHSLRIETSLPRDQGKLVADLAGSGMGDSFSITGWQYDPFFETDLLSRREGSDFGSIRAEGKPRTLGIVAFVVQLHRPVTAYALKFLIPLVIILLMSLVALGIGADRIDVRASIGITALLACVAFEFAAGESIPDVPYLVVADKLFLGSYVLNMALFAQSLVAYRLHPKRPRLALKLDRIVALSVVVVAACGGSWVVSRANQPEALGEVALERPTAFSSEAATLKVGVQILNQLGQELQVLFSRGLLHYDEEGRPVPFLVEEQPAMTNRLVRLLPSGGMSVTWRLRPGLKFGDGNPITGADLAASLARLPSETRTALRLVDERTVEVEYSDREPAHLSSTYVYPAKELAGYLDRDSGFEEFNRRLRTWAPPSTGPYSVESFEVDKRVTLVRNPHFHGRPAAFERIEVTKRPRDELLFGLEKGELHLVQTLIGSDLPRVEGNPALVSSELPAEDLYALVPDLNVEALKDVRVRKALMHALDREALIAALGTRGYSLAHTFRRTDAADFAEDAVRYAHDPARAKALLEEAGYGGRKIPVALTGAEPSKGSANEKLWELIVPQLRAVGFEPTFKRYPPGSQPPEYAAGTHGGLWLTGREINPLRAFNIPLVKARPVKRPHAALTEEELRSLHDQSVTLFEERALVISERLQRTFAETLPILPIAFSSDRMAWRRELVGPKLVRGKHRYWNVEDWRVEKPRAAPAAPADGE